MRGDDDSDSFLRLLPPDDDDVEALLRQCASRVLRLLRRELDDDEPEADALAALEAASLAASLKVRPGANGDDPKKKRLTAFLEGLAPRSAPDIAHFLRTGRLAQLGKIVADPEASENDRFVALELLKNAVGPLRIRLHHRARDDEGLPRARRTSRGHAARARHAHRHHALTSTSTRGVR